MKKVNDRLRVAAKRKAESTEERNERLKKKREAIAGVRNEETAAQRDECLKNKREAMAAKRIQETTDLGAIYGLQRD